MLCSHVISPLCVCPCACMCVCMCICVCACVRCFWCMPVTLYTHFLSCSLTNDTQVHSQVTIQSLVYLDNSRGTPASGLWMGGALGMRQQAPFPPSGRVSMFNTSLLDETGSGVKDFQLTNILSAYNRRQGEKTQVQHFRNSFYLLISSFEFSYFSVPLSPPVTTYLDQSLSVWEGKDSRDFTLEVELIYPPLTVTYFPGFWQLIKFAWIQYLSILVVFWWLLTLVQSFVFHNQVILTIKKNKMNKLN